MPKHEALNSFVNEIEYYSMGGGGDLGNAEYDTKYESIKKIIECLLSCFEGVDE